MFSRRPAPRRAPARPQARPASTSNLPAKKPAATPPAPMQQSSGGMLSGIGSTIAQGMAFGTGSAIAHRAIGAAADSMSGDSGDQEREMSTVAPDEMQVHQNQGAGLTGPCAQDKTMFFDCLKVNQGDQQACGFLYETLQTCQRNENQMSFS